MQMNFSNLKVGSRLALGFGAIILILLAVAGVGSHHGSEQPAAMQQALDADVGYSVAVLRLRTQIANMRRYEKDMAMNAANQAKAREYLESWRKTRARADEHLKKASELSPAASEIGKLKQLEAALGR